MLVKNESDIVANVIADASRWADRIFVMDNGSTDGTWEIIQTLKNSIVCPWKQDFRPYTNGLRADIFNEFRKEAKDGDWWCFKLDADEFYIDNPRSFLKKIPKRYGLVAKKSVDYCITTEDIAEYQFTGNFLQDREHIKYVKPLCWQEPRFFRYRNDIVWPTGTDSHYPAQCGKLFSNYILVRHYQYRSPVQMQARLDIRNSLEKKRAGLVFRHVTEHNWQELLKHRAELVFDDGDYETYQRLGIKNTQKKCLFRHLFKNIFLLFQKSPTSMLF